MIRPRELIHEIHRRSIWQVLSIYVAGSWGALQAVEMVVDNTSLPEWVLPFTIVLLLIGLPVVLATAFVQEGMHRGPGAASGALPGDGVGAGGGAGAADDGAATVHPAGRPGSEARQLLTWKRTLLAGLAAFALLGFVSVGWFVRSWVTGGGPLVASIEPGDPSAGPAAGEPRDGGDTDAAGRSVGDGEVARRDDVPEKGASAGQELPVARPPAAPGRPADGAPRVRQAYLTSRATAEESRRAAVTLGVTELDPAAAAEADSLWESADRAASRGRYEEAIVLIERSRDRWMRAVGSAEATWRGRIAETRSRIDAARAAADPASPEFARALARQEDAARYEGAGNLPDAYGALVTAADLYGTAARPTTAEASPPEPEEPPAPSPREVVIGVLDALRDALAAEDLDRVASVWVSLSRGESENLEGFFRAYDEIRVAYDPVWSTLATEGGEIRVTVRATWRFKDDGHEESQPPFDQTFSIAERGGRWVIVRS